MRKLTCIPQWKVFCTEVWAEIRPTCCGRLITPNTELQLLLFKQVSGVKIGIFETIFMHKYRKFHGVHKHLSRSPYLCKRRGLAECLNAAICGVLVLLRPSQPFNSWCRMLNSTSPAPWKHQVSFEKKNQVYPSCKGQRLSHPGTFDACFLFSVISLLLTIERKLRVKI